MNEMSPGPLGVVRETPAVEISRNGFSVPFVDQYGDLRHLQKAKKGAKVQLKNKRLTVAIALNRAVGPMIGARIRARRLELGMTMDELAHKAGLSFTAAAKNRVYEIENSKRKEGVRLGTLYAIAVALDCSPLDLMPPADDVMEAAGVSPTTIVPALSVTR